MTARPIRKGDIVERLHSPGERCVVTGRIGDFLEFIVVGSERLRLIGCRGVRVVELADDGDDDRP